ncbi:cysteine--1-D-myo-inosityl 2-amino-2-deoxy-alpha-D-glucopyranoside ligase [Rarobacter faecitabidus]|uniref:L-cysteine:1D-myo-inositol 2-amino-2-deoxy-alpha-D-glucopyranoside ligase n=1 Tax=Rarobacter faecitabidus TaxID=13243 RepID=A0A542ZVY4_RARFA|nr:cysteine--1-D-myo-inosityl 2-amino-2-deoxy-alpha-D-glucopyranoside ligase [Rarobacter faecitabidus]TQL64524.1 cysteinyl-tRNA synthetase [Rarobacter faecitabidus]
MLSWPRPTIPDLPDSPHQLAPVRAFDSSARAVVDTVIEGADKAGLYVCGVTPYDATHVGHAATYLAFDVLHRAWIDAGLTVLYTSNVTDVDDPLLERATATGVDWRDLAEAQSALYGRDMTALSVIPPDTYISATESIPAVIDAIEEFVAAGLAYFVPAPEAAEPGSLDVYADLSKIDSFGSVAHLDRDGMLAVFAERGGDPGRAGKRDELDPLLWLAARPGEPSWDGRSLGHGRPGWHIECAVIARAGLGAVFDVQGGGQDLLFPHHEMSTAHSQGLDPAGSRARHLGARHHVHAGLVSYQGEKMSKSLGNLVFVSTLLAGGAPPAAIRVAILSNHYRRDWEWYDDAVERAQSRISTWRRALSGYGGADPIEFLDEVRAAVRDDLDTPRALRAMDEWSARTIAAAETGDDGVPAAAGIVSRTLSALLGIDL